MGVQRAPFRMHSRAEDLTGRPLANDRMDNLNRRPASVAGLEAELSAVAIDTRCALVLARVALETLASAGESARTSILLALENEIAGQQIEQARGADAIIGMLSEMKLRLNVQSTQIVYLD